MLILCSFESVGLVDTFAWTNGMRMPLGAAAAEPPKMPIKTSIIRFKKQVSWKQTVWKSMEADGEWVGRC